MLDESHIIKLQCKMLCPCLTAYAKLDCLRQAVGQERRLLRDVETPPSTIYAAGFDGSGTDVIPPIS
jgi:hypothetical protein